MAFLDYKSLPIDSSKYEIRLVTLLPYNVETAEVTTSTPSILRASESKIRLRMKTVSLSDSPGYTALSYAWGDSSEKRTILVDDVEVSIGMNLESAFYHLRQASNSITLWADALCINQFDDKEKSEQVQLMKRIYGDAAQVIVWLGPSGEDSDLALDVMNQIGKEAVDLGLWNLSPQDWLESRLHKSEANSRLLELVKQKCQLGLGQSFDAIARLSNRPWWDRIWILQEFVLARDGLFSCGFSTIQFSYFVAAYFCISSVPSDRMNSIFSEGLGCSTKVLTELQSHAANPLNPHIDSMVAIRRQYHNEPRYPRPLMGLLRHEISLATEGKRLKATDPRDKIYGILSLARDADVLGIQPDYTKSCDQVYIDTARALLQHGYWDLLALSQFPKRFKNLPTWAPDWSSPIARPRGGFAVDGLFNTSRQMSVHSNARAYECSSRLIAFDGVRVDVIDQVGTPSLPNWEAYDASDPSGSSWGPWKTLFPDIESFCDQSDRLAQPIYKYSRQREEAVWRIPCADLVIVDNMRLVRAPTSSSDLRNGYMWFKEALRSPDGGQRLSLSASMYSAAANFEFNKRAFLSVRGYVGLVPSHAEVGDILVIIYGVHVPLCLREVSEGLFNLVGEAYVHGIMDGEFIEKDPPTEIFPLC